MLGFSEGSGLALSLSDLNFAIVFRLGSDAILDKHKGESAIQIDNFQRESMGTSALACSQGLETGISCSRPYTDRCHCYIPDEQAPTALDYACTMFG